MNERQRILTMLKEGTLTPEEADQLLTALENEGTAPAPATPTRRGHAQLFRIHIDVKENGEQKAKINVNVPLGLAKFAGRFMPEDARKQLDAQGIDLAALVEQLEHDLPDGPLVDIDVDDEKDGTQAKIRIEVI
jgi:hypothetical protein